MAFHWRLHPDLTNQERDELGAGRQFPDQVTAEAWLALNYLQLDAAGVRSVSLLEEDRLLYGPMSLEA